MTTARRAPPGQPSAPPPDAWRASVVFGLLAVALVGLAVRALWLSGVDSGFLQEQGSARSSREIEVPAHRGRIVDRNGEPLAISTPVRSVWAFPAKVGAEKGEIRALAALLEVPPRSLEAKLASSEPFVYLARQIPPDTAARVAALRIPGINDEAGYRRYYPAGETTSHLIGFTGDGDVGQEGIELGLQSWLGGTSGSRRVTINRRGEIVEDIASIREPQAGRDLALAIDLRLQYLAFRELRAAVVQNKAKAGGVVVLDAASGEILALANWPAYNPNLRSRLVREAMRNRALIDVFEPGSTMKPFTVAAALEAGRIRPDSVIDTAPGSLTIGNRTIRDTHAERTLTVSGVLQKSSNVGAARIGLGLPAAQMWKTLDELGFGSPLATGFPGEVTGRLRPPQSWHAIEQATISYGHGISVNLVQLARAYTVFANDGVLVPVSLVKREAPVAGVRVLSPATAQAVRQMLETVVMPGGTAPRARITGYRVAGKTGTAHKLEQHQYADRYIASFVGLAPASRPRLIVALMIDEPAMGAYYGGEVAAPVFAAVMSGALRTLGVPADAPLDSPPPAREFVAVRNE